jgi:NAD(P)-dependent dehydrogenase (short-subunit alcohol dehydrogenase family)
MATSTPTAATVLITGANRGNFETQKVSASDSNTNLFTGIGRGLLAVYLSRPDTTAIAAVRDTTSATTLSLKDLPHGSGSKLIIVKIDNVSLTDAGEAVNQLKAESGITSLDVVIANAGIARYGHSPTYHAVFHMLTIEIYTGITTRRGIYLFRRS